MPTARDEVLALLAGDHLDRVPAFSGLPSLTAGGLLAAGVSLPEAHQQPEAMAAAAGSTFERYGFESAVAPFDLCVEAEALGAQVDFHTDAPVFLAPVCQPISLEAPLPRAAHAAERARVPVVAQALRALRAGVGRQVAVGACLPGPFTLGWQLYGAGAWMSALAEPASMAESLAQLAEVIAAVAHVYRAAGADFLTIHEMGGSPQVLGPRAFATVVKPALVRLFAALPRPAVLSVCGDTNKAVVDLAACGADALSLDERNDIERTRATLGPGVRLLGNVDPVGVLAKGTPEQVEQEVARAVAAGVDAIWPGCDLWPEIPEENFRALMRSATSARRPGQAV